MRPSWNQVYPGQEIQIPPHWGLNALQSEFLEEEVYQGAMGDLEAIGLAHQLQFKSGLDVLSEQFPGHSIDYILEVVALMDGWRQ